MTNYRYTRDCGSHLEQYPADAPFAQRDQSARNGNETTYVVICDIADMLRDIEAPTAYAAALLVNEATALWPNGNVDGWLDDADAAEKLHWLLEDAEALAGIDVEWDGDAGTVTITAADRWERSADIIAECCDDCLMYAANGETPAELDEAQTEAWLTEYKRRTAGYHVAPICDDYCDSFGMASCDLCGSPLGGNRHRVALMPVEVAK